MSWSPMDVMRVSIEREAKNKELEIQGDFYKAQSFREILAIAKDMNWSPDEAIAAFNAFKQGKNIERPEDPNKPVSG